MKVSSLYSGMLQRRGQGSFPSVTIHLEAESEEEKAIIRMAKSGARTVYIYDSGACDIQIAMPRGKN